MEKIGINCDKIKRATQILKGDRGYVCTGEWEQFDDKQEKKRKAEEELREQEEKRLKTITSGEEPKEKAKSAELEQEEGYQNKLARQQQEIIRTAGGTSSEARTAYSRARETYSCDGGKADTTSTWTTTMRETY